MLVASTMLVLAFLCSAVLIPNESGDLAISFLVAVASYLAYWFVLIVTGYTRRLVPTIAAIMATGSILTMLHSVVFALMRPIATANLTVTIAWLILIWAIPVKGHVIARAIGQHWFAGIAIAMTIFVMQNVAYFYLIGASANQ